MHPLSMPRLIWRRLVDDWKLLLCIFSGIVIATSLVAGAPVYLKSLERLSINIAIDRASLVFLDVFAFAPHIPLEREKLQETDAFINTATERYLASIYRGRDRYLKVPTYLVGLPRQPLTDAPSDQRVSRGYFQYLSNLEHHVTFLDGRMASDQVTPGPRGPIVEAVLGEVSAEVFDLQVGDEVVLTPSLGDPTRLTARVVGILEPTDPTEEYWQHNANIFIEPEPLDEAPDVGVEVDPEEPPLALFITREAMIEGVGKAYPGTLVSSTWFTYIDKEGLKRWSPDETSSRISAFEHELAGRMSGSAVFTGIKKLLSDFQQRSFFTSVPLLLLLSVMVITVLYFLAMMVSYLVQSREADIALLRSRGVNDWQLLRLYALEGLVLTVTAVVLAPFIAMGVVSSAGLLPYFREMSGGGLLPVELRLMPFLVATGAGLLCLVIFVVPALLGSRTGLVIHKLRSSRPPSIPIFQRYYLDVGLLTLGGLVFWELYARGHLVSGGLFRDISINEALLLAPVLFLTAVALLFMRFFPLFVRFISGESAALLHLLTGAVVIFLGWAIIFREVLADRMLGWAWPVALLLALAVAYVATERARRLRFKLAGFALQGGLVALFVLAEPLSSDRRLLVSTLVLMFIVPAQVAFLAFKAMVSAMPVWMSMSLWRMARNPLQYSWLVLLLVLVAGLGILSTTVGGTLDRSYRERILYDVGADIRVSGIPGHIARGREALKERYLTIPGVTAVSLALRGSGSIGSTYSGGHFQVLAVESQDFHYLSWYRPDFSERPLDSIMRVLQSNVYAEPVVIPDDAVRLAVWVKPQDVYPNMFLWMVIRDRRGVISTVTLGRVGAPEWHLMSTEVPQHLQKPLHLVSVQIFEPVFGPAGTPGTILLDNIHTLSQDGEVRVLEDFEGQNRWTPLATSLLSSDSVVPVAQDVYSGRRSGLFSFGKDTDRGIRGFYQSPTGGPVPLVTSSSFLKATGARPGDEMIVNILGRLIPVSIRDEVDYFPTLDPSGNGFVVADLDNLLRHLNILAPTSTLVPNELFLTEAPGADDAVREVVYFLAGAPDLVHDRELQLEAIRLDPLITAGWKAMMLLSLGIILFVAGLGYITYLLSFADRSRVEMGFLRSLGISRHQMMGLLGLENLVIVAIGLGLGTWAGFQMSTLLVSSVAVTETGDPVVPPFILVTDWNLLVLVYTALLAVFAGAIYALNRSILHLDLHTVSRVEAV